MEFRRRSIRLDGYDYSKNGLYFVTIDVQNKLNLFNDIVVGADPCVRPNAIGEMVNKWWRKISDKFSGVYLDEFIIMPDHLHGIIIIKEQEREASITLGEIIQWFKTMTTNYYFQGVKINNWPKVIKRLWQRDYYERIIRNEIELVNIRKYIQDNPKNWKIAKGL